MVLLSIEEIRSIIRPVGLSPMKSKGIHGLSIILIDKHNGKVPRDLTSLVFNYYSFSVSITYFGYKNKKKSR